MIRRLPLDGMKPLRCKIALLVACAMVFAAPGTAPAQVFGGGYGGNKRAGGGHPGTIRGGGPAADTEPAEPAEPEEGPPEKQYDRLPVDTKLRTEDGKMRAILLQGKFADSQTKTDFDKFYTGYFLSRWSVQEDVTKLPKYRRDLSSHLRTAIPGAARNHLISLTLDFLKKLVVGNFHPAVKINAMLAIGELNSVEQNGLTPPVPLPAALDVLISAAGSKLSDGIRVAAMVGILRHASAGIPSSDARKKVSDLMLRLVAGDVPAGPAISAQAWMVAQAAETLGALGAVGQKNDVFTALAKLAADGKLPFVVRCTAAGAMGHLNYSSANGIDVVKTAAALGRLAIDACKDGVTTTEDTTRVPFRRRMLYRLDAVQTALGGIESLAKPPQKAFITGLQAALKDAIDELDHKTDPRLDLQSDPKLEDMKETVIKLQAALEQLLQKKP